VVEREHRTHVATFHAPDLAGAAEVELDEAQAHHARVRRIGEGDTLRLTDGRGASALGEVLRIAKSVVRVRVLATEEVPAFPEVHLFVPVADRDRMLLLAEKVTELAVTSWRPVLFERSRSVSPRGEGEAFEGKVRARMLAALEQSGGAWLPEMFAEVSLEAAASFQAASRLVCDQAGGPIERVELSAPAAIMVGPEGGIAPGEWELLRDARWTRARIPGGVLRFETAAIVMAGMVRSRLGSAVQGEG
jgi:16S rRNA (uracil1498-N3)-methyltransferase